MSHNAITDVPGIKVGHWTNKRAATGCTVVLSREGAIGGVDVRGAAPGTRETDLLRPGNLVEEVHAVLLTGGSTFGLDAATGVMRWCENNGIGVAFGGASIPIVPAAVIFDLGIGRYDVRPDADAGYKAVAGAKAGRVSQGSVGAGTGATVAKALGRGQAVKGGLGTASETTDSGLIVGALVAVNAVGEIFDGAAGKVIAGPRAEDGSFADTVEVLRSLPPAPLTPENTTIGIIATNARLNKGQINRLASVAHDGIARAVRPAHSLVDGDAIFGLASGARQLTGQADIRALEALSALAMERAILNGMRAATSVGGLPAIRDLG